MKYLCLIYHDEQQWGRMSKQEIDAIREEYGTFAEDIGRGGHLVAGEELEPVATATTIRVRNGKMATTDGPFAETKEQLGGFFLIEAKDLNEAIRIAARIPSARTGSVEVRPVKEMG